MPRPYIHDWIDLESPIMNDKRTAYLRYIFKYETTLNPKLAEAILGFFIATDYANVITLRKHIVKVRSRLDQVTGHTDRYYVDNDQRGCRFSIGTKRRCSRC